MSEADTSPHCEHFHWSRCCFTSNVGNARPAQPGFGHRSPRHQSGLTHLLHSHLMSRSASSSARRSLLSVSPSSLRYENVISSPSLISRIAVYWILPSGVCVVYIAFGEHAWLTFAAFGNRATWSA
eukprot:2983562-Rhodomonas_salina.1